jgi:UDP-2,4-diacetamido-2,4,6-trideoxy-beta-L-altropyranose hydrolase
MGDLTLRPATTGDAQLLLDWRNDDAARANSLDSSVLELGPHKRWLDRRLGDREHCRIYVAEADGRPVGQLRVVGSGRGRGVVSVSIAAEARGRGLGTELIRAGTSLAAAELGLSVVEAVVKPGNAASLRAFASAGYAPERDDMHAGQPVTILAWRTGSRDPG